MSLQHPKTGTALASGTIPAQPLACTPHVPVRATVTDWCRLSGMGRSATYEALGRGDLRACKLGTRTLIDVAHGLAWLDSLPLAKVRPRSAQPKQVA